MLSNAAVSEASAVESAEPGEETLSQKHCPQSFETAIALHVRVTPPDARVYLDDELISVGSYQGFIDRSMRFRVLRVVSSGFIPWTEAFLPVCDTTIAVVLARQSRHSPPPPKPVRVVLRDPFDPEFAPESEPPSSTDPFALTMIW
jgi:hypothetical protein